MLIWSPVFCERLMKIFFVCLSIVLLRLSLLTTKSTIVYVGTYTGGGASDSKGIYAYELDERKSNLTLLGLAAITPNPSYIIVHPSNKYLYAVNEHDNGQLSAFQIDSSQPERLTFLNKQSSRGSGPCYLSMTKAGNYILVANYNNGAVAVLPINGSNGNLQPFTGFNQQVGSSIDPDRQTSAHAHCIRLDPNEEYALSADLGSDQIYRYRFGSNDGSLIRLSVTPAARPGDGPRHLIFSPSGKFVYLMNELKSVITVWNYFPTLELVQIISTLPADYKMANTGAEVIFHPLIDKYLYASNRGHDSIAVFSVDSKTGFLSLIQHINVQGRTPRNFNISPDGKYLIVANQDSNNLVLFTINSSTGKLSSTGSSVSVNKPMCVKYLVL